MRLAGVNPRRISAHEWHGPTACADWEKGLLAYNDKSGITDGDATVGTPWTVDVNEDRSFLEWLADHFSGRMLRRQLVRVNECTAHTMPHRLTFLDCRLNRKLNQKDFYREAPKLLILRLKIVRFRGMPK